MKSGSVRLPKPKLARGKSLSDALRLRKTTREMSDLAIGPQLRLEHTAGFEEPGLHDPEVQKSYYFVDRGIIAGNVYIFAASQGLACWFHNCDRATLTRKLRLRKTQRVLKRSDTHRDACA